MSVKAVQQEIERHLNQIKPFFVPNMELTFIARKPDNDRADFVVTNDSLAELAKVIERMQIQSGQPSEVATLRAEVERLTGIVKTMEDGCYTCRHPKDAAALRAQAERVLPLGELVDKFLSWPLPESVCVDHCATVHGQAGRIGTNLLTATEAQQMFGYLFSEPSARQWHVHILGPDDIIPCVSQFDALRKANDINREWAKWCAENPSPNNPLQIAVVEQRAAGEVV